MLTNNNRKCPACSVQLRMGIGDTAVCPKCFRQFSFRNEAFKSAEPKAADAADVTMQEVQVVLLIAGIVVSFAVGLIPLAIVLTTFLVSSTKKKKETGRTVPSQAVRYVPCGKVLETRADYLRTFRAMPLYDMPLGSYGERAISQIERLEQKQQALITMLGKNHPFIRNGDEAEKFILRNCKQILYRLRFCDQSDPNLCRVHADFLSGRLAENEKLLRDYENLVIEVSQLDLDTPETAPCLDVLAETLHDVRTRGGALTGNDSIDCIPVQQQMCG